MVNNQEAMIRERKHIRLNGYDYSQPGEYFVTICAKGREHLFVEVVDGEMNANSIGVTLKACWNELPAHFPNVEIDKFVVMPNHVHGIIRIVGDPVGAGKIHPAKKRLDNPCGDVQLNIPIDTYHSRIFGVWFKGWMWSVEFRSRQRKGRRSYRRFGSFALSA